MRVLVVTPTFCEVASLPGTLARLRAAAPAVDVLVVDDDSPDGTGECADALAADPQVHVLHRRDERGLGSAYVAGFTWALARDYDVVVEMDADGSHRPEELRRLLAVVRSTPKAPGADLVLGSRWVPGGQVHRWPRSRRLLSRGGNAYARAVLGVPLRDVTGGYRAYRAGVLRELPLARVASQGYSFQVDMAWRVWRAGHSVVEVPITFDERQLGSSKMSPRIVREALWRVTAWGAVYRTRQLVAAVGRSHATARRHVAS